MKKSVAQIVISVLALLNVLFVPIYDVWGGLFPKHPEKNFLDAIDYLFKGEFDLWLVQFTFVLFIPTVFMLIFSLLGKKRAAKISAGIGIALIVWESINFFSPGNGNELTDVFDFDESNISIGFWIGIALFIAMIVIKTDSQKKIFHCNVCNCESQYTWKFDRKLLTWENIIEVLKNNKVVCILLLVVGLFLSWLGLIALVIFVVVKCSVYKVCSNCKTVIKKSDGASIESNNNNSDNI